MSQRTKLYIAAGIVLAVYIIIELIPLSERPDWLRGVQSFLPSLMLIVAIWLTFTVRQAAGLPYRPPRTPIDKEAQATPKAEAETDDAGDTNSDKPSST